MPETDPSATHPAAERVAVPDSTPAADGAGSAAEANVGASAESESAANPDSDDLQAAKGDWPMGDGAG